ncbi:PDR/VanB family oxidoreductase [Phytopseudomonas dryadis]|uniref:Xanthine hydroxylase reductase n=1 Tax=Phytopseudomonas dryadis TaxID=2487520 RepID=A0A4Q9R0J1_9GAMM|nr:MULTISPECIES: PDR/VanB family oxidoreductase [Pseudomonas]TBU91963.1 xanthine hydroxylase reductase [Pseudomonas dryadis]TBV05358.1 xanthine hydroxylase reductase [Pseudomonas dryadis]TBV18368.1 xanthine hydroxylase reductase [Pseudomonas sp. FRB 230]
MSTIAVTVSAIEPQGRANRSLRLEAVAGRLPAFEAGAHIDLHLPNGLVRQYSLANAPHQRDHYLLCVKREPGSRGGSEFIHSQLAVGCQLQVSPPRNAFPLRLAEHCLLVAAGIGITPLLSMAETLQAEGRSFSLHYYTRTPQDVAFADRLRERFAPASIHLHHSSQGRSPRQHLPAELLDRRPGSRLYLCGPQAFMAALRERAHHLGWPDEHVHSEAFAACAEERTGASFEVRLARSGRTLTVNADQSIAAALMASGVDVPLSCEMGICGACLTGLLEGQGDHRDHVLSEAEKAADRQIALCCSRSRSARLVLDI